MRTIALEGKTIDIFPGADPQAPVVCLNTFPGEGKTVYEMVQAMGCPPFTLAAVSGLDWNRDMTPWESPPAFPKGDPCSGGADAYLRQLTGELLPAAERACGIAPRWRGIAGYSLAGLFALYAVVGTSAFSRAASVSGSLWFPGMKEYVFSHEPERTPDCVYFSLGDKESRTRNPVLRSVRRNTEEIHAFLLSKGIDTVFQLNPGNHFTQAAERTAAGICWLLSR